MNEIKINIMDAVIDEFNEKGVKFTMDDIAKRLGISKKTIYKYFSDKKILFWETVDYCFDIIKHSEEAILVDSTIDTVEKLKKLLIVMPDRFMNIDWRKVTDIAAIYPDVFERIVNWLDTGWEPTILLLQKGIEEKQLKDISIPVFKVMFESSIKGFLSDRTLTECNVSYEEALKSMIDILLEGIMYE